MNEVKLRDVHVGSRFRKDLGDIELLAQSIAYLGLLQPVVITPDGTLIAGERRLMAVKSLGWDVVPVNIIENMEDATALLMAERDENTCRKDMTHSERVALAVALEALEIPAAKARVAEGGRRGADVTNGVGASVPTPTKQQAEANRVREKVGKAVGYGSGRTYERVRDIHVAAEGGKDDPPEVVKVAKQLVAELDQNLTNPKAAERRLNQARNPEPEQAEPVPAKPAHKGRGNEKRQIKALEASRLAIYTVAEALEAMFSDGFEKTCTPEVAANAVKDIRADVARVNKIVRLLESHAKGKGTE